MEAEKTEVYENTLKRLEDIVNSQESIIEKIGVAQVDLFNTPDKFLTQQLNDLYNGASNALDKMKKVVEDVTAEMSDK